MINMHCKYVVVLLIACEILNNRPTSVECQTVSVLPSKAEQVNLLTNVYELFEEVKLSAKEEQMAMDKSMITDLELMMNRARFSIETLQELVLLKLSTRSNAVCALDAKDEIENAINLAFQRLKGCADAGLGDITENSLNLTKITESAVFHGEEFLDKLNDCSNKRGLGVISCYKKIIQNDVLPVKAILSEAIKNHRKGHLKAFDLKSAVNICVDTAIDELKDDLEQALNDGLNCT